MALDWRKIAAAALRAAGRASTRQPGRRTRSGAQVSGAQRAPYPGDFTGTARLEYAPRRDGRPDPGEVVWTWVPYEDDASRGKDRPVLVVARDDPWLLALMLSSKDHEGPGSDEQDERRFGRTWLDLGPGAWDRQQRPSQVRTDRVLRVDPAAVRREGSELDATRFEQVAAVLRRDHGWV